MRRVRNESDTPWTWTVRDITDKSGCGISIRRHGEIFDSRGRCIAQVESGLDSTVDDTSLMAAAPEMYAGLRAVARRLKAIARSVSPRKKEVDTLMVHDELEQVRLLVLELCSNIFNRGEGK